MLSDLQAVPAFVALGHPVRLDAFRLLMRHAPEGLPSGEVAAALAVPPTAMSFHLSTLERCGLAVSSRRGRNIVYAANVERIRDLIGFLTDDCCGGRPEVCGGFAGTSPTTGCGCEEA